MERTEVFLKVKETISRIVGIDGDSITMESSLAGDLNLISIEILTILTEIEDFYEISIPEQEYLSIVVVGDYVDCILRYKDGT